MGCDGSEVALGLSSTGVCWASVDEVEVSGVQRAVLASCRVSQLPLDSASLLLPFSAPSMDSLPGRDSWGSNDPSTGINLSPQENPYSHYNP